MSSYCSKTCRYELILICESFGCYKKLSDFFSLLGLIFFGGSSLNQFLRAVRMLSVFEKEKDMDLTGSRNIRTVSLLNYSPA